MRMESKRKQRDFGRYSQDIRELEKIFAKFGRSSRVILFLEINTNTTKYQTIT